MDRANLQKDTLGRNSLLAYFQFREKKPPAAAAPRPSVPVRRSQQRPEEPLSAKKQTQWELESEDSGGSQCTIELYGRRRQVVPQTEEETRRAAPRVGQVQVPCRPAAASPNPVASKFSLSSDSQSLTFSSKSARRPQVSAASARLDTILSQPPLRAYFCSLLSAAQRLPIGVCHQRLLKVLRQLDNSLSFLTSNRRQKYSFFVDLKRSLFEYGRMEIGMAELRQLVWVDKGLYGVQWQLNARRRGWEIVVWMGGEEDRLREERARGRIVEWLKERQAEWAEKEGEAKVGASGWLEGFDPNHYDIPLADLPPKPNTDYPIHEECITAFSKPNQASTKPSLPSSKVSNLIFSKTPSNDIKKQLNHAIRHKQAQPPPTVPGLTRKILIHICKETMLLFLSKGVGNIFRDSLMDALIRRLNYKPGIIEQAVERIIRNGKVDYLRQVPMVNQRAILQVSKMQYDAMLDYLGSPAFQI